MTDKQTISGADDLAALFDAFNRHDRTGIMRFFAPDAVFNTVGGPEAHGSRIEGEESIGAAFEAVWRAMPDARWKTLSHFVAGDRAVSEWLFTGTAADGSRTEAEGADIFTLSHGLVCVKQALRKNRPALAPLPVTERA